MEPRKELLLAALDEFVRQRPGFDPNNYDRAGYRADSRRVARQRADFYVMLRAVHTLDSITADNLLAAARSGFSGRLSFDRPGGETIKEGEGIQQVCVSYCTGQYFCTEYRAAACAVLAAALWASLREDLPAKGSDRYREILPSEFRRNPRTDSGIEREYELRGRWMSAGDWLRKSFAHWFGRSIAGRWFN
jgi:hypothetical protein